MEQVPDTYSALFWGYSAIFFIFGLYIFRLGALLAKLSNRVSEIECSSKKS